MISPNLFRSMAIILFASTLILATGHIDAVRADSIENDKPSGIVSVQVDGRDIKSNPAIRLLPQPGKQKVVQPSFNLPDIPEAETAENNENNTVDNYFAPSEYKDMEESEKLSAASFEQMESGVQLSNPDDDAD